MSAPTSALPFRTPDLPGTGGVLRQQLEDFRVDESLPYEASGEGAHVFVRIEKRGLTTPQAAEAMARALGVNARDVGWAGMKDKRAVTRQTLSFPPPVTPEAVRALRLPDIDILAATCHGHKLRTGHVRQNRFVLRVRDTDVPAEVAAERALAILERLDAPPGCPNWFGAQRFGTAGNNAELGLALVLGRELPPGMRAPRGRKRRLYVSALQSELFNEYVRRRLVDGLFDRALLGDVMQKTSSGGVFACTEPERDQPRVDAGEIVPTGPMFGHRAQLAAGSTPAGDRERALLADRGVTTEDFARVGKLGTGTRRPLAVRLGHVSVHAVDDRAIELCFDLPAGSYATVVVREVVKGNDPFPG